MPGSEPDDAPPRPGSGSPVPGGRLSEEDHRALAGAKQVLRRAVRTRRAARGAEQRSLDDRARFEALTQLLGTGLRGPVAAYLSTGDEPSTTRLVGWLAAQDVEVLLPVLSGPGGWRRPDWARYRGPGELRPGPRDIPEPVSPALGAAALAAAEVVVVAGLAGTERGDRLGTGGGWYDRALGHAAPEAVTVLLLNDDEVLPTLPSCEWDRRVDVVVTPTRVLPAGG